MSTDRGTNVVAIEIQVLIVLSPVTFTILSSKKTKHFTMLVFLNFLFESVLPYITTYSYMYVPVCIMFVEKYSLSVVLHDIITIILVVFF